MKLKPYTVRDVFQDSLPEGIDIPPHWSVSGGAERTANVPEPNPHYVFEIDLFLDLINWHAGEDRDGMLLYGPPGCGKTAGITQFCALLNLPLFEKTVYRRMRFEELVARIQLLQGSTFLEYGPLARAMGAAGEPGILLLNEVDHAQEGVLTGLNEVLQGGALDVLGFETLKPSAGFRFCCTANTGLMGDSTGLFRGALRQNYAFADRLWRFECRYPEPEQEAQILRRSVPELPGPIARTLIKVANDVRAAYMGESADDAALDMTISTRSLIRWARGTIRYKDCTQRGLNPIVYALDKAILGGAHGGTTPETRAAVIRIVQQRFGDDLMPEQAAA